MGGGVGWEGRDGMGARLCNLGDDARVVDVVTSLGEEVHDIRAFLCHEGVGCGVSTYMQGEVRRKCAGATGGERERERACVWGGGGHLHQVRVVLQQLELPRCKLRLVPYRVFDHAGKHL